MRHYTNKKTLQVYGYENDEVAKQYNDDYINLVLMSDELFQEHRKQPIGGKWTLDGWIIDEEQAKEEHDAINKAGNIAFLSYEINRTEVKLTQLYRLRDRNKASESHLSQIEELEDYSTDLMLVENQKGFPLKVKFPLCPEFFKEVSNG